MPLQHRFTKSGKEKQRRDELEGWKELDTVCDSTPFKAEVDAVLVTDAGGGESLNTSDPNYEKWKEAHKTYTKKARKARQEQQKKQADRRKVRKASRGCSGSAAPDPVDPTAPKSVDSAAPEPAELEPLEPVGEDDEEEAEQDPLRLKIRAAILTVTTSEASGTTIDAKPRTSLKTQLDHFAGSLATTDKELADRGRHGEAHDLSEAGIPPLRIFVAPEWFFRPAASACSADEHRRIFFRLVELSLQHPDWLIVPGSIYWTPDDPKHPPVQVYNQCPILAAGRILKTRTKLNEHDLSAGKENEEVWGMELQATNRRLPASMTAESTQPAFFTHDGLSFCLDICRDHFIGEGACAYAQGSPTGAGVDVYIVTSNNVVIAPHFVPVRDNGILIHCDGAGKGFVAKRVERDTGPAALAADLTTYYTAKDTERSNFNAAARSADEQETFNAMPTYVSFQEKYDALFDKSDSCANPTVRDQIAPLKNIGETETSYLSRSPLAVESKKNPNCGVAYRVRQMLARVPDTLTTEETRVATDYANYKSRLGNAIYAALNPAGASASSLEDIVKGNADVTITDEQIPGTIARQPQGDIKVYELIDPDPPDE